MISNHVIFGLVGTGAFFSLFASTPTPVGIAATVVTILAGAASWWTNVMQERKNKKLQAKVDEVEGRTKVETGVAAAFVGQGPLATWTYEQLVHQLHADGFIDR